MTTPEDRINHLERQIARLHRIIFAFFATACIMLLVGLRQEAEERGDLRLNSLSITNDAGLTVLRLKSDRDGAGRIELYNSTQRLVQVLPIEVPRGASTPVTRQPSTTAPAAPNVAPSSKWKDKANWRRLQKGMTQEQVRQLLGEPDRISTDINGDDWRYGTQLSGGRVSFDSDSHTVTGWFEP